MLRTLELVLFSAAAAILGLISLPVRYRLMNLALQALTTLFRCAIGATPMACCTGVQKVEQSISRRAKCVRSGQTQSLTPTVTLLVTILV